MSTEPEAVGSTSMDSVAVTASSTPDTTAASAPSTPLAVIPNSSSWAIGTWRGAGAATVVKLELPGNQGVQLAWVQDKGSTFVGPIDVNLELLPDGTLKGDVHGCLGELRLTGNWDGHGAAIANVNATQPAADTFNGVLTLPLSTQASSVASDLRVVSNDGRWVRQAAVQLTQR